MKMNIACAICSELLIQSDEIFHTPCGHIFHFTCLGKWLERSNTCPQCRERTTTRTIHRVYFNFANDSSILDSTFLQSRVDSLSFQLTQKDHDIVKLTEEKKILQDQTDGLKHEIKRIESEMRSKISTIYALKEQIAYYKCQCVDAENTRKELEQSKKEIQKLKNLQNLIDTSTDEIDEAMLAACYKSEPTSIITYIAVMKKELKNNFSRRRELREKVTSLQKDLMKIKFECQNLLQEKTKRKELEEIMIKQESYKVTLQAKLLDMHVAAYNCTCGAISAKKRKCPEGCKEHSFQGESNETIGEYVENLDQTYRIRKDSCTTTPANMEDTPQDIKSQGFFSMRNKGIKRSGTSGIKVPSILAKKSKLSQLHQKTVSTDTTFDGFGGHAKYDKFPSPIKNLHVKKVKEESKMKKQKLDTGNNQKLSDLLR